jgi:hypothetical protein
MRFAEKLERLTKDQNKARIARAANLPTNAINEYIAKGYTPRVDNALALSDALGVSLEWLVDDRKDWPPPSSSPKLSIADLPSHDLMMELARRHRLLLVETLRALEDAQRMIDSKNFDAPPAELRRILVNAFRLKSGLENYSPQSFAAENHSVLPGSERPVADFEPQNISEKYERVRSDPGFDDAMRKTFASMSKDQIPNPIPGELFVLILDMWSGKRRAKFRH